MYALEKQKVLVAGDDQHGRAAARLLRDRGALVTEIHEPGARLQPGQFDLVVTSPAAGQNTFFMKELQGSGAPVISDLELAFQESRCLSIGISGTNGKSSTASLLESILQQCDRATRIAGHGATPACEVVDKTKDLDFLTFSASVFQLQSIQFFRPSVAVLLNITHDHQDSYSSHADYIRAKARLFQNQQPFDWAIVQTEALAQMRSLGLPLPAKIITFSANNRRADIFLDRGLIISQLEDWGGPLLDISQTAFRGFHHAENLMAALAVSRVLRLPLERVLACLKECKPLPGCCELVGELNGVKFINDARSNNLESLRGAVSSVPGTREPNVWLIAGGQEKQLEYHDLGPLLSQRIKGAFLFGKSREKLRSAWSLFTPCTLVDSLLEAVSQAAAKAAAGDTIIFSPACSGFDHFRNDQHRGDVYRDAVAGLLRTTNGVGAGRRHNLMA